MQTLLKYQLVIPVILLFGSVNALYEGDQCFHQKKGVNGVCKVIEECSSAKDELLVGIFPQNCGFKGNTAIVCCLPLTSTTTGTTTARPPLSVGEKSRLACKSYESLAYEKVLSPLVTYEFEYIESCPWDNGIAFYRGPKAFVGEFPHMALIGYGSPDNYAWLCSGSLINEKFVLTAAHCLSTRNYGEPKSVRLGDLNYTDPKDDKYLQQINIKRLHKHPDYKLPTYYNDLALLELEKPANLSLYVKPACLYTKDSTNESHGLVTGWGNTEDGLSSEHLLRTTVQRSTSEQCNRTYSNNNIQLPRGIDESIQVCYAYSSNSISICQGGAPIQLYSNDVYCSYNIFGVASFGKGCNGLEGLPEAYVKLYPYIDWIERIVWP